jgi:hypothetical protein
MRARILLPSILLLFLCSAAFAGVTIRAEDGANDRIDTVKLTKLTETAIRRAVRNTNLNVSIVFSAPEVKVINRRGGLSRPAEIAEFARARYTITDANGNMLETVPWMFPLEHAGTLDRYHKELWKTAEYIAGRVAALTRQQSR